MLDQIIELFNSKDRYKISFHPEIRVSKLPGIWVDDIYKVRDNVMVTLSTLEDKSPINIKYLNEDYLKPLLDALQKIESETVK